MVRLCVLIQLAILFGGFSQAGERFFDIDLRKASRPRVRSEQDTLQQPLPAEALSDALDFVLIFNLGSFRNGATAVRLHGDGAVYILQTYWVPRTRREEPTFGLVRKVARLRFPKSKVDAIRALLAKNPEQLRENFFQSEGGEGPRAWLKVQAGGKRIGAVYEGHIPKDIAALHAKIIKTFGAAMQAALQAATPVNPETAGPVVGEMFDPVWNQAPDAKADYDVETITTHPNRVVKFRDLAYTVQSATGDVGVHLEIAAVLGDGVRADPNGVALTDADWKTLQVALSNQDVALRNRLATLLAQTDLAALGTTDGKESLAKLVRTFLNTQLQEAAPLLHHPDIDRQRVARVLVINLRRK